MPVVFFLNRLHPHVSGARFEQWVRDVDYPMAHKLSTITSYVVSRIDGSLDGSPSSYQYIERVEVTDLAAYQDELASAQGMDDFFRQWASYVAESIAMHGEEVPEAPPS